MVDSAHGATYQIVGPVYELGADVVAIGAQPDGLNINYECGATHSVSIQEAVIRHQADLGIALDGDGDRVVMADKKGVLYDGDRLTILLRGIDSKRELSGGEWPAHS